MLGGLDVSLADKRRGVFFIIDVPYLPHLTTQALVCVVFPQTGVFNSTDLNELLSVGCKCYQKERERESCTISLFVLGNCLSK